MQEKIEEKFCFWDNMVSIRREYLSSAVNVLTNSYKAFWLKQLFPTQLPSSKYGNSAVFNVFEPVYHVACQRVLWNRTFWTYI